jgi:hypothetical protein
MAQGFDATQPTFSCPQYRSFRRRAMSFSHAKHSSIRFLRLWLTAITRMAHGASIDGAADAPSRAPCHNRSAGPPSSMRGDRSHSYPSPRGCDESMEIESKHACNRLSSYSDRPT